MRFRAWTKNDSKTGVLPSGTTRRAARRSRSSAPLGQTRNHEWGVVARPRSSYTTMRSGGIPRWGVTAYRCGADDLAVGCASDVVTGVRIVAVRACEFFEGFVLHQMRKTQGSGDVCTHLLDLDGVGGAGSRHAKEIT